MFEYGVICHRSNWGLIIDGSKNSNYNVNRTLVRGRERGYGMSTQELELVKIIYENDNPEKAVLTAIKTFAAFLEQLAEDPEPPSVCPLESA